MQITDYNRQDEGCVEMLLKYINRTLFYQRAVADMSGMLSNVMRFMSFHNILSSQRSLLLAS